MSGKSRAVEFKTENNLYINSLEAVSEALVGSRMSSKMADNRAF